MLTGCPPVARLARRNEGRCRSRDLGPCSGGQGPPRLGGYEMFLARRLQEGFERDLSRQISRCRRRAPSHHCDTTRSGVLAGRMTPTSSPGPAAATDCRGLMGLTSYTASRTGTTFPAGAAQTPYTAMPASIL